VTLTDLISVFRRWLYLPDPGVLEAVLATIAAHRIEGDPLWLLIVEAPSGGKTEILNALSALDEVHHAATLTEPALLSGTPKREKETGATGGLLREVGSDGILVCKDFGSILSQHHDTRAAALAALREVYDGAWDRPVGTGGGRILHWRGRLGLLAGCTPIVDKHAAVIAALGERFLAYRPDLDRADDEKQAARALRNAGRERAMRRELADAVAVFFNDLHPARTPDLSDSETERLIALAQLTVRIRSAVERDRYTREVELVLDAEFPARLASQLARLRAGLLAIGTSETEAWRVVTHAARSSAPKLRRRIVDHLLERGVPDTTSGIATSIDYPTTTTRRALEELVAHQVARRRKVDQSDEWTLAEWVNQAAETASASVPANAATPVSFSLQKHTRDFAGTVPDAPR
jgi:hypothetical protein